MIQMSPPTPGSTGFGGGAAQGMATGRTANFGYGSLGAAKPLGRNTSSMQGGAKLTAAPFQGTPSEPIGIQPAGAPAGQQKQGGGGGIIGRGMNFLKGSGEGGGEGAAVGEAAGEVMAGGGPEDPVTDVLAAGTLVKGLL